MTLLKVFTIIICIMSLGKTEKQNINLIHHMLKAPIKQNEKNAGQLLYERRLYLHLTATSQRHANPRNFMLMASAWERASCGG